MDNIKDPFAHLVLKYDCSNSHFRGMDTTSTCCFVYLKADCQHNFIDEGYKYK